MVYDIKSRLRVLQHFGFGDSRKQAHKCSLFKAVKASVNVYNGQSFKVSCLTGHGECLVFQITRACCTGQWGAISCALLDIPPKGVM